MPHPGLITDDDFQAFLDRLAGSKTGSMTLTHAARLGGFTWPNFRHRIGGDPGWRDRFEQVWQERQQQLADRVDDRIDKLVMQDDPAPSTVALWAKRHNPAYRDKVEVSGPAGGAIPVETRTMNVDLAEVARIMREAGVIEPEPDRPVPRPELLPAPSDA